MRSVGHVWAWMAIVTEDFPTSALISQQVEQSKASFAGIVKQDFEGLAGMWSGSEWPWSI